jgi:hypothetical protein
MTALIINNMAPIMFGSLVIFLLLGYPAAFSLGAVGLIFALVGIELGLFVPDFLQALPERVYGVMSNDTLLAIPFFTFMGARRPRLRCCVRRRTACGHYWRGCGLGHFHGADLAADHDALRL